VKKDQGRTIFFDDVVSRFLQAAQGIDHFDQKGRKIFANAYFPDSQRLRRFLQPLNPIEIIQK
jgi:hypothetical protein